MTDIAAFDPIKNIHLKMYLLCTLLILKRIKFAKQRRKRIRSVRKIRSSRSQMLLNIGVLENFANFAGKHLCWSLMFLNIGVLENFVNFAWKHLCWSLFLIKLVAFNFIKRDSNTGVFLWNLLSFYEHLFCRTTPVVASGKSI